MQSGTPTAAFAARRSWRDSRRRECTFMEADMAMLCLAQPGLKPCGDGSASRPGGAKTSQDEMEGRGEVGGMRKEAGGRRKCPRHGRVCAVRDVGSYRRGGEGLAWPSLERPLESGRRWDSRAMRRTQVGCRAGQSGTRTRTRTGRTAASVERPVTPSAGIKRNTRPRPLGPPITLSSSGILLLGHRQSIIKSRLSSTACPPSLSIPAQRLSQQDALVTCCHFIHLPSL